MSNYWPSWEDQTKPCECGCGQSVGLYDKGSSAGFVDDDHVDRAYNQSIKQYADDDSLPTFQDVISGKEKTNFSQQKRNLGQLIRARGAAEMLGNQHETKRIDSMIAKIKS